MTTTTKNLSFIIENLRPEIQKISKLDKLIDQQYYIVGSALVIIGDYPFDSYKYCAFSCMPNKPIYGNFPLSDLYLDVSYARILELLLYDLNIIFEHQIFSEPDLTKLEPFFTTVTPEIVEYFSSNMLFGQL